MDMNSPRSQHNNLSSELRNIITNKNALTMKSRMKGMIIAKRCLYNGLT